MQLLFLQFILIFTIEYNKNKWYSKKKLLNMSFSPSNELHFFNKKLKRNFIMKKTNTLITLLLSVMICLSLVSCSNEESGSMADASKNSESTQSASESASSTEENTSKNEHEHDANADFVLHVTAEPSKTEAGVINAIITLSHIKEEISAIQFDLTYTSNTVEGIYTTNDEMAQTMTTVPMYEMTTGVSAPRFEQICVYKKDSSIYRCMYVDLLSYPSAKEGQTFTGMKNDGEMVITIPFKINSNASAGNIVKFDFISGSVKGTKTENLVGAVGEGTSFVYTITENDLAK